MPRYSQTKRPFKIKTPLGKDVLLLVGFSGVEAVSTPFEFTVDLYSEDDSVNGVDLLRKPVTLHVNLAGGGERVFHGLVREFSQGGQIETLVSYRMKIAPAFWFLSLTGESRIYQHMNVLDIARKVFKEQGVTEVDFQCKRSYPELDYCVQYRESHFDFLSRLFEDEGIHYYFEHTADKHTLVLSDDSSSAKTCPGAAPANMAVTTAPWQEHDVIVAIESEYLVHTGKTTFRDYDFEQPSLSLEASASGRQPGEWYDYPGGFNSVGEGSRYAKLQVEEDGAEHRLIHGEGNCRYFLSGHKFSLQGHYRADMNGSYNLVEVRHAGQSGDYRTWEDADVDYRNDFVAMPVATKFRPKSETPRPIIGGTQTAVVVGPGGEEIFPDKYGRVKVQFHWDRDGKKDENSSCWVRVASTWAGKQWGFIQIPRIGQEVVVAFLEGDPDQPLIVGSVYNAEQMPPYALPGEKTQSGVKSRSSLQGGPDNFNEIRFEDKKGSELIRLHAEKDHSIEVEHNRDEHVGNDETYDVGHDQTVHVGHDRTETVDNDESITISGNRTESVAKDETISIDGARTETVGKDETITITKNRTESVGKDENVDIGQHRTVTIAKNETLNIGETRATEVGKDNILKVGKKYVLEAGDEVAIKTGDASITMKKDGTITIKGKDITIQGSGKINVKADSDVVMKGSKVLSN